MTKPHSSKGATMSEINYSQAKKLTLNRLREVLKSLPVSERPRPRYIIDFKSYSILDLIAQVERDTEVGKTYVYDTAKQLNYVVSG